MACPASNPNPEPFDTKQPAETRSALSMQTAVDAVDRLVCAATQGVARSGALDPTSIRRGALSPHPQFMSEIHIR